MSQAADKERWLIRLIVIKKVLLAAVLLVISLTALYGDIYYAQLSDFADTWGQPIAGFWQPWPSRGLCLARRA